MIRLRKGAIISAIKLDIRKRLSIEGRFFMSKTKYDKAY